MNPRWRFVIILLIVIFVAAWCGSRLNAQERAKPRSGGGQAHGQSGNRGRQPSQAQPRQHDNRGGGEQRARPQQGTRDNRGDRGDRAQRDDAQRRHPQPGYDNRGGRSDGNRGRYEVRGFDPDFPRNLSKTLTVD